MIPTISSQLEQQRTNETRKQLDEIKEALIGYAIINGRLPCPASSSSNGVESFATSPTIGDPSNGICLNFFNGFVPAATLGVTSIVDSQGNTGFAVDSWGNRIRYAVTKWSNNTFTRNSGMSTAGLSNLNPDLLVCSTASTSTSSCSVSGSSLTSIPGVPVIIFSTGKNGAQGGTGTDEAANLNNDRVFVSHTPTLSPNEFDDHVTWLSPNILINRMVAAGKLP